MTFIGDKDEYCWAYIRQAQADLNIATHLSDVAKEQSIGHYDYHIIALAQRATEKSIKALYLLNTNNEHRDHPVSRLIVTMTGSGARLIYYQETHREIVKLFTKDVQTFVKLADSVYPRNDPKNSAPNTEYPFIINNKWVAPCDINALGAFNPTDFLDNAKLIVDGIERMRSAIRRR